MSLLWKQWADTELFPTLPPFSSIKSKELYKNSLLCEFKIINFLQYTYKITKYFTIPWSVVTIFSIILSVSILCNIEENVSCMKMHRAEDIERNVSRGVLLFGVNNFFSPDSFNLLTNNKCITYHFSKCTLIECQVVILN